MVTVAKIENRKAFEISKNVIIEGFDNQIIAKLTGLMVEQIEQLRNK